jgi:hypothetical protein
MFTNTHTHMFTNTHVYKYTYVHTHTHYLHGAGDSGEGLDDLHNLLRLGIEILRLGRLVVDAVLLAAGDANLHLQHAVDLGHALQVVRADGDVLYVHTPISIP